MSSYSLRTPKASEADVCRDHREPQVAKPKYRTKSSRTRKRKSSRKCKICGKDPYPNYFFCQSCHHRIDSYEEGDI